MSSGKVLLGVLAGIAVGGLLGILFAPEKGSTTRNKMSKKAEDYTDGLKDKFNEFIDDISEKFEKSKEEAAEFAEQAKTTAEATKKDVKSAKG